MQHGTETDMLLQQLWDVERTYHMSRALALDWDNVPAHFAALVRSHMRRLPASNNKMIAQSYQAAPTTAQREQVCRLFSMDSAFGRDCANRGIAVAMRVKQHWAYRLADGTLLPVSLDDVMSPLRTPGVVPITSNVLYVFGAPSDAVRQRLGQFWRMSGL